MTPPKAPRRDHARLSSRFRPASDRKVRRHQAIGRSARYRFHPQSVRQVRPLAPRLLGLIRRTLPGHAATLAGIGLIAWGAHRSLEILDLRADQVSLVNTLLLVFAGCFLLFLASHEQAVERASLRGRPGG